MGYGRKFGGDFYFKIEMFYNPKILKNCDISKY